MSSEDPTTYRSMNINTGFLKKEFYDLRDMLLHPHSLQNNSLKLIHIDRGTTNISKIQRTTMTSRKIFQTSFSYTKSPQVNKIYKHWCNYTLHFYEVKKTSRLYKIK